MYLLNYNVMSVRPSLKGATSASEGGPGARLPLS